MSAKFHPVCFICGADRSDCLSRCKRCNGETIVNVSRRIVSRKGAKAQSPTTRKGASS